MKSNNILRISIVLSIALVIATSFRYRPASWTTGSEALGCLVSVILMVIALLLHRLYRNKIIDDFQKRNVALGLGLDCYGPLK